jgi:hypothetical protein
MDINKLSDEEIKARRENYERTTMTVFELYEALGELVKIGDGDAMIDVDDNCGGSYSLSKFNIPNGTPKLKAVVGKMGKWVTLGF